jgi:NAD-dependent SIR2 family protein deacetylase
VKTAVILSGAGISAESGPKTFRGADGLWEGHRVADVACPGAGAEAIPTLTASVDRSSHSLAGFGEPRRTAG